MVTLHDCDDDEALRATFRQVFTKYGHESKSAEPSIPQRAMLWDRLTEMGALDMAIPESRGGGGATLTQLCVLAEEAGRNLQSLGLIEHLAATYLLRRLDVTDFSNVTPAEA